MRNHQSVYNNIQAINSKRGGGKRFSVTKTTLGVRRGVEITELADLTMWPSRKIPNQGVTTLQLWRDGLIICKEFVQKNKGEIWIENKEKGTLIKFSIPVN